MSKISLSPDASGTGIFTIASPNSNTNRTLTLPDDTGTIVTNSGNQAGSFTTLNTSGAVVFNDAGADVDFRVESDTNANAFFLDGTNGNIGIGDGTVSVSGVEIARATGAASPTPVELRLRTTTNDSGWSTSLPWGRLSFYSDDASSAGPKIQNSIDTIADLSSGGGSSLTFNYHNGVSLLEGFRLNSSGNVGIGTSSPSSPAKMQVNVTPITPSTGSPGAGSWLGIVGGTTTVGDGPVLNFTNASGVKETGWRISAVTTSGNNGDLAFYGYNGGGTVPERMRLTAAGNLNVVGALSKGSGSFKIDHPLKPETHHLVHSFIEGPQADLIYRGKVELVAGRAEVNIDTVARMTEGTFIALNREVQCFTSNESDWDVVRGSVNGNILTIECQNAESTATISWLVIGERQDQHMYDTDWTDENGKVIVEPLKPVKEEVEPTDDAEDAALEGV